jgi:hypothetical protein
MNTADFLDDLTGAIGFLRRKGWELHTAVDPLGNQVTLYAVHPRIALAVLYCDARVAVQIGWRNLDATTLADMVESPHAIDSVLAVAGHAPLNLAQLDPDTAIGAVAFSLRHALAALVNGDDQWLAELANPPVVAGGTAIATEQYRGIWIREVLPAPDPFAGPIVRLPSEAGPTWFVVELPLGHTTVYSMDSARDLIDGTLA